MKEMILAERYARALISLGLEEKCLDRFKEDLARFSSAMKTEPGILKVLSYREVALVKRKAILAELSQKLLISPEIQNFFKLLVDRERTPLFPKIVEAFNNGVRELEKVVVAKVLVAEAGVGQRLNAELKAALEKMTGSKVEFSVEEDPSLIGGMQVSIGDSIYDASIKGELERIKEKWI